MFDERLNIGGAYEVAKMWGRQRIEGPVWTLWYRYLVPDDLCKHLYFPSSEEGIVFCPGCGDLRKSEDVGA